MVPIHLGYNNKNLVILIVLIWGSKSHQWTIRNNTHTKVHGWTVQRSRGKLDHRWRFPTADQTPLFQAFSQVKKQNIYHWWHFIRFATIGCVQSSYSVHFPSCITPLSKQLYQLLSILPHWSHVKFPVLHNYPEKKIPASQCKLVKIQRWVC